MLTEANVRRINDKIADKVRELDSIFTSPEKREEIRKDLIVLNDLLRAHKDEEHDPEHTQNLVDEICRILRNARR